MLLGGDWEFADVVRSLTHVSGNAQDPDGFIDNGGWNFLDAEGDGSDEEGDEEEEEGEPRATTTCS